MKGFKKLALVAAIAAPFSSVHALEAIDDSMLAEMTGQSGVTIDLTAQIDINTVTWTDTATLQDQAGLSVGGGQVIIGGIRLGGVEPGTALDNIRINIDSGEQVSLNAGVKYAKQDAASAAAAQYFADNSINPDTATDVQKAAAGAAGAAAAAAVTSANTVAGKDALKIEIRSQDNTTVDLGLDVDYFKLGGNTNDLVSDITMDIELGPQDIIIYEDAADTAHIDMAGYFKVTDMGMTVDMLGMGISGMVIGDVNWDNFHSGAGSSVFNEGALKTRLVSLYGQLTDEMDARGGEATLRTLAGLSLEDAQAAGRTEAEYEAAKGLVDKMDILEDKIVENTDIADVASIDTTSVGAAVLNENARGMARYAVDISANAQDQLVVDVVSFSADIGIADITMGGGSIGSLAIDNLNVTNTSFTVYGH